jgi:hypothetical protein
LEYTPNTLVEHPVKFQQLWSTFTPACTPPPPYNQRFDNNWKQLEKTKRMSPIPDFLLKPLINGSHLKENFSFEISLKLSKYSVLCT